MKKLLFISSIVLCIHFSFAGTDIISQLSSKISPLRLTEKVIQAIDRATENPSEEDFINASNSLESDLSEFFSILDFYQRRQVPKPVLGFIIENRDIFREYCKNNQTECIRVAMMIHVYRADIVRRYEIHRDRDIVSRDTRHRAALQYVPEDVIVPDAPTSSTYQSIVVDISKQLIFAYEEGELVYVSPVTTGMNGHETPLGNFSVRKKQTDKWLISPFKYDYYKLWVDYWVEFLPGYGFHDACNDVSCWRTKFGGPDYTRYGSHGCINMPYDAAEWLSGWALVGTAVRVQA